MGLLNLIQEEGSQLPIGPILVERDHLDLLDLLDQVDVEIFQDHRRLLELEHLLLGEGVPRG